ncbi:type II secretion system F family protein [Rheinheimera texasensis]|uniref:type II secretion system F family protein n=1 Tax=Rheinheimera texasensis TaxID=306205 RepID=UPI0032B2FDFA
MNRYSYKAFDQAGAPLKGVLTALDQDDARQQLKARGLLVSDLQPEQKRRSFSINRKLSLSDLEFLTAELSVLLDAGLKIDKGVEVLARSASKPAQAELLNKISGDLKKGLQLSQVLRQTGVFDALYINLVEIGEATGQLAQMFRKLAEDLAFRRDLQQKVTQAMTYPAVVLSVCLGALLFILNFVVPNMAQMFRGQQDLPIYTEILLGTADWFGHYQWYLLLFLLGLAALVKSSWHKPQWQAMISRTQLRLPFLRTLTLLLERIRFNGALSMMLNAGVSIDQAMTLAAGSVRQPQLRHELESAIARVKRGEQLSAVLGQSRIYPQFYQSLLVVGEETGELGRIFNEITNRSQKEFSQWVLRFTSLLEPLMILFMGGLVGGVVVILMMSITSGTSAL